MPSDADLNAALAEKLFGWEEPEENLNRGPGFYEPPNYTSWSGMGLVLEAMREREECEQFGLLLCGAMTAAYPGVTNAELIAYITPQFVAEAALSALCEEP